MKPITKYVLTAVLLALACLTDGCKSDIADANRGRPLSEDLHTSGTPAPAQGAAKGKPEAQSTDNK